MILCGLGLLLWPRIDQSIGEWRQHELAVASDRSSTHYAWAVNQAYEELSTSFEDALVTFRVGAVPVTTTGRALGLAPDDAIVRSIDRPKGQLVEDPVAPAPAGPPDAAAESDRPPPFPGSSIRIPAIDVDQAIVEGVARADLKLGPGHYPGTALPGEHGNMVISGHRTTYTKPFHDLDLLQAGDVIYIDTPYGSYEYLVQSTTIVDPENVEPLRDTEEAVLTLTTCDPKGSAEQRLIVRAHYSGDLGG